MQNNKIISFFRAIATWSLVLVPVVALLGFFPITPLLVDGTKIIIISALVSLALVSYLIHSFAEKKFALPHHTITSAVGIFFGTYLVSALMSDNFLYSFFGIGLEMWTVTSMFLASVYLLLVTAYAQDEKVRFKIGYALLIASTLAVVPKVVLRFVPDTFSVLGLFAGGANPNNTVGRWFDFGFVAVALALVTLLYVSSKSLSVRARVALWIVVALSAVAYVLTSSLLLALLLSVGSFLVYTFAAKHTDGTVYDTYSRIAVFTIGSLAALIFGFQFITGQSPLFYQSAQIPNFSAQFINYRDYPGNFISETIPVVRGALAQNPVFGAGPNLFQDAWNKYKNNSVVPADRGIQTTVWWQTEFSYGGGIILTILGQVGILGILGFLIAIGMLIRAVYQNRNTFSSTRGFGILMISALGLAYAIIHTPSVGLWFVLITVWALAFSYSAGVAYETRSLKHYAIPAAFILVALVPVYGYATRTTYLTSAILLLGSGQDQDNDFIKNASLGLQQIADKASHSAYAQVVVSLEQTRAQRVIEEVNAKQRELSQEQIQAKAQEVMQAYVIANKYAERAVVLYPQSYATHLSQAQILALLTNSQATTDQEKAQVENWHTASKNAFAQARVKAPTNPVIDMLEANLAIAKNDLARAEQLLVAASEKQPALTQPLLTLTQIKVAQEDFDTARQLARRAVEINPRNIQSLYMYGQLERQAKNFQNAEIAFRGIATLQSPNIQPEVARLLADMYVEAGQLQAALPIYEEILKQNPSDTEVQRIIENLKRSAEPETPTTRPR